MSGFIYAIECGQRVKIGFSMQPMKRLSKIASDAPFPCRLLGYWRGSEADELAIHEKFQDTRVHGEWFAATEALMHFIAGRKIDLPAEALDARKSVDLCGFLVHPLAKFSADANISIAAIAEKAGVSRMTIYRLMKGEQNATIDLLTKVSAATGGKVPVSAFLPSATSQEKVA
jgi:DNA-binding phage protein